MPTSLSEDLSFLPHSVSQICSPLLTTVHNRGPHFLSTDRNIEVHSQPGAQLRQAIKACHPLVQIPLKGSSRASTRPQKDLGLEESCSWAGRGASFHLTQSLSACGLSLAGSPAASLDLCPHREKGDFSLCHPQTWVNPHALCPPHCESGGPAGRRVDSPPCGVTGP